MIFISFQAKEIYTYNQSLTSQATFYLLKHSYTLVHKLELEQISLGYMQQFMWSADYEVKASYSLLDM